MPPHRARLDPTWLPAILPRGRRRRPVTFVTGRRNSILGRKDYFASLVQVLLFPRRSGSSRIISGTARAAAAYLGLGPRTRRR